MHYEESTTVQKVDQTLTVTGGRQRSSHPSSGVPLFQPRKLWLGLPAMSITPTYASKIIGLWILSGRGEVFDMMLTRCANG